MTKYHHRQVGTLVLWIGGVSVLALVLLLLLVEPNPVGLAVLFCLLACFALFSTLTVDVIDTEVRLRFTFGAIRRGFPLDAIKDARPVRNAWYYGWGVRILPRGWLYNVSGLDAVELEMTDGRVHRIGTDQPAELARAIRAARAEGGS